jgi:Fur family peroxide stress response transcriptional regulator
MFQESSSRTNAMTEFERTCRQFGVPLTVQRRAVLDALVGRKDHPTADDIYAELHPRLPQISRPTVYRVLDTLVKIGIARKVCHPGAAARFETKIERHHHLVCVRCDKVMDFEHPALDRLSLPDARDLGFVLDDYSIHFRGVCADCARGDARRPAGGRAVKARKRARQKSPP